MRNSIFFITDFIVRNVRLQWRRTRTTLGASTRTNDETTRTKIVVDIAIVAHKIDPYQKKLSVEPPSNHTTTRRSWVKATTQQHSKNSHCLCVVEWGIHSSGTMFIGYWYDKCEKEKMNTNSFPSWRWDWGLVPDHCCSEQSHLVDYLSSCRLFA